MRASMKGLYQGWDVMVRVNRTIIPVAINGAIFSLIANLGAPKHAGLRLQFGITFELGYLRGIVSSLNRLMAVPCTKIPIRSFD